MKSDSYEPTVVVVAIFVAWQNLRLNRVEGQVQVHPAAAVVVVGKRDWDSPGTQNLNLDEGRRMKGRDH
jgi:hypothetical protein